ncbi:MAG: hypothetical protein U0704_15345 [Candidatus Eisenbacteria bacterium]
MLRRLLPFVIACVVLFGTGTACAEGVSLAWSDCGAAGSTARSFACNSNTGTDDLYLSFVPPTGVNAFYEIEAIVQVGTVDFAPVPDWWNFVSFTGCRRASLLTTHNIPISTGACVDPYALAPSTLTQQVATALVLFGDGVTRRMQLRAVVTLAVADTLALDPGTEYYGVRWRFNHTRTVGTGACAGCTQAMCLALGRVLLRSGPAQPVEFALPQTAQHAVTWNGGSSCDRLVPVRNRTWGALKSLYR